MDSKQLSHLTDLLIASFEEKELANNDKKIAVSPIVSKFASWYEKLRNAMEYREEEVILRASIERILKRRLLLGGNAKTTAEPLVRELIWAGYLPNNAVPETIVEKVERSIDLYLALRLNILQKHSISDSKINEWTYHLMSSEIAHIISSNTDKEKMSNFAFQILKDHITIRDDTEGTKNAQVFIAVRKAFARDDTAFLCYHLFLQFFGSLNKESLEQISSDFVKGYREIYKQLNYPRKDKIYTYVKKQSAVFIILEDILRLRRDALREFLQNEEELTRTVFAACEGRYKSIGSKVNRAIIRSVIFILLTKAIFAVFVEGTYERLVFGKVLWSSILINTGIPPILMLIVGAFLRTPDHENSKRILSFIQTILHEEKPRIAEPLVVQKTEDITRPILNRVFAISWFLAFILSFGGIVFILTKLHFNVINQLVFIFFLAIVSFLSYRISLTAHLYQVGGKEGSISPVVNFLFMPVVRVGRRLTQGIVQINFILFLFDLIIETPFKVIFGFFEQWFGFLNAKREELE